MRKLLICLCSAWLVATPLSAQELQPAPTVEPGLLSLADAPAPANSGPKRVYVVQMAYEPGARYDGGVPGYAATKPGKGQRYNAKASHVQQYTDMLTDTHDKALKSVGARNRKVYSYVHSMNGFAAKLSESEVERLRGRKDVVSVWEDFSVEIDTNDTPEFLGLLDRNEGLRERFGLRGEDVIVGVLDTGAVQEHPSFSENRLHELPEACDDPQNRRQERACRRMERKLSKDVYGPPPAHWNGICQPGEGWSEADCNNKLIGARWFVDGFLAGPGLVDGEFLSPRDASGHGTHTASTAAGNENVPATLNGNDVGVVSGVAPRARVAVYKVCWLAPGAPNFSCFFSDSAAATDAAVADGVDVINFSVGTAAAFNDPQDLAFLDATTAGVFVARSAGNSGPGPATTNAGEPWVTSVGASTADGTLFTLAARVNSPASVAGDYSALEGVITGPLSELGPITDDVVAADPIDACGGALTNSLDGKIALIARGACTFVEKVENAVDAGASAILMYTDGRPKTAMGGTATAKTLSVPGVMIDNQPGLDILAALEGGATVNATLDGDLLTTEPRVGNIMADFSSRGPYPTVGDWIKPDITAPGVAILAGSTPEPADGSAGGLFQYLQGTSMSSPHIAGLAALVIEAQPDWSPAQVKSALMTTARQDVVKEDGATPADPFDFGAGHVDPNKAVSPGLTYDAGLIDYLAASCGTSTPLVSASDCDFVEDVLGLSTDPADLNLPSIGIDGVPGVKTVTRTVTGVKPYRGRGRNGNSGPRGNGNNSANRYDAVIEAPPGFEVEVNPSTIRVRPGETAQYEVTVTNVSAPPGEWRFGSLSWSNRKGVEVHSPIAVNAAAFVAPDEISQTGPSGADSFDVTFGYTGDYTPLVHGLNEPTPFLATVEDDPGNDFQFLGPGTAIAFLSEVPEGTAYVRWSTFNEYTTGDDDIDLYLYYCPNLSCTQIGSSGNPDSNEQVEVLFPINDPNITDPYLVFAHGFDTEGGLPADLILFANQFGIVDDAGNLVITSAPSSAELGTTGTISYEWGGLREGVGAKQLGAISHSDATGIIDLTIIGVTNDEGFGICDFGVCSP